MYVLASESAEHAAHAVADPGVVDILLWGRSAYVALVVLIGVWRYRTDQYGWTTRSSQIYEGKWLRIGSPLFHYGLAASLYGPRWWSGGPKFLTDLVVSDETYHIVALVAGSAAAVATIVGMFILLGRRATNL